MSENSLYKLFYIDREAQRAEYEKRFNSSDSVHMDLMIGDNPAFFVTTQNIYRLAMSIMRSDREVEKLNRLLPPVAIEHFTKRCLIDEIMQTNDIEGVHSTRRELESILSDVGSDKKNNRFSGLVNKYYLLNKNTDISFDTCEDIRNIYDELFGDEIRASDPDSVPDGLIFRKNSVSVYSDVDKELHRGLFPEKKIIDSMDGALKFLKNSAVEPLFRIAAFHYLFGYIHPFYDGNGRCSRFISSCLLSKELNPLIAYRLSYTIKDNIKAYYDAFKLCNHHNNKGEITPFIEMFLSIVEIAEKQLVEALRKRKEKLDFYGEAIKRLPNGNDEQISNLYFLLVQASLFSDNGIDTKDLQTCIKSSYNTLKSRLEKIPTELMKVEKFGRNKYYMLNLENVDKII
ncbi:MAG: Fic family protein [Clostridia bacterium]